jgi:antitoxin component HigA of HigAB toxin-antitoxin module
MRTIRTTADHERALQEISTLMAANLKRGTPEFGRLDSLVYLVHAYEEARHSMATISRPDADQSDLLGA